VGDFTQRLTRFAKRRDEEEAKAFPRETPCHDCAFRPGSPERQDPEAWANLKAQTDPATGMRPFYCHFAHDGSEMPVDAQGVYVPKCHPDGRPKGYPMCAGWVKTFGVQLLSRRHGVAGVVPL